MLNFFSIASCLFFIYVSSIAVFNLCTVLLIKYKPNFITNRVKALIYKNYKLDKESLRNELAVIKKQRWTYWSDIFLLNNSFFLYRLYPIIYLQCFIEKNKSTYFKLNGKVVYKLSNSIFLVTLTQKPLTVLAIQDIKLNKLYAFTGVSNDVYPYTLSFSDSIVESTDGLITYIKDIYYSFKNELDFFNYLEPENFYNLCDEMCSEKYPFPSTISINSSDAVALHLATLAGYTK